MAEKHIDNKTAASKFPYRLVRKSELITGVVLTLIAVLFHLTFMRHAGAFWRDEVGSIVMATMPSISDIWHHLKFDSFPIFPFVLLRLWTNLGAGGESGLRMFGFLVGVSILGVLWLNGRLLGYRVPLLSLALFAFNPCAIGIGDNIRPHGVGILLLLLFFGLLWKTIEQTRTWQVIAVAIVGILSVQCLYQNAFFILAAIFAGIVVTVRQKRWKTILLLLSIGIVAAISLLPYRQIVKQSYDAALIMKKSTDALFFWPMFLDTFNVSGWVTFKLWIGFFVIGICIFIYSQASRSNPNISKPQKEVILFCTITVIIYAISFLYFLRFLSVTFHPWYSLPLIAVATVFFDIIFNSLNLWNVLRIALAIVVTAATFGVSWQTVHIRQTSIKTIASILDKASSKNDIIVVNPWYFAVGFQYYYKGATPFTTLPPIEDHKIHRFDLIKAKMASVDPIQPVLSEVSKILKSGGSVWVVGNLNLTPESNSPQLLPPAPNSIYGWSMTPYTTSWEKQFASFMLSHSRPILILPPERNTAETFPVTKFRASDKLGRNDDEIEGYKQIIKIKPDYAGAYYGLGMTYGTVGCYQEQIEAFRQALKIEPDYAQVYYDLGIAYGKLGRFQDEMEAYKHAIEAKPDFGDAYYNLGASYSNLGRYTEAIAAFKKAIKYKPDDIWAHYGLGFAYLKVGGRNEALEQCNILKSLDAEMADKLFKLIYK